MRPAHGANGPVQGDHAPLDDFRARPTCAWQSKKQAHDFRGSGRGRAAGYNRRFHYQGRSMRSNLLAFSIVASLGLAGRPCR